jgi:hypothetical protein
MDLVVSLSNWLGSTFVGKAQENYTRVCVMMGLFPLDSGVE